MLSKTVMMLPRPSMPILMGLCLGIGLSMILVPLLEDKCHLPHSLQLQSHSVLDSGLPNEQTSNSPEDSIQSKRRSLSESSSSDSQSSSMPSSAFPDPAYIQEFLSPNFDPVRTEVQPAYDDVDSAPKIKRPKYAHTELKTREKWFVGVLSTADTVGSFASALNQTIGSDPSTLIFFMNSRGSKLPSMLPLVIFAEEKLHLMPFHMLKYAADHYPSSFDWFLLAKDNTYIQASKLYDQLLMSSAEDALLIGKPVASDGINYCDFNHGILLSYVVMQRVIDNLEWCVRNAVPHQSETVNVGKCIFYSTQLSCSSRGLNKPFLTSSTVEFTRNEENFKRNDAFLNSLIFGNVKDPIDIYRLHRFFCTEELKETFEKLHAVDKEIAEMVPQSPDSNISNSWPLGIDPPIKPKSRFHVVPWDYFTETHIYSESDPTNMKALTGVNAEDIHNVIQSAADEIQKKTDGQLRSISLVNGYRRFQANRGMDYVLDLLLADTNTQEQVVHRVSLMRPLGQVEIAPMPYVTESTRVNLILPITENDRDSVMSLVDSFAHISLDSGDNSYLFIIFVYSSDKTESDPFSVVKSMITFYENKHHNGAKIAWSSVVTLDLTPFTFLDTAARKFSLDSLLVLCHPKMSLSLPFLNRVRLNVIAQHQVFFPIAFHQYKPNLVYKHKPYPAEIKINRDEGRFDSADYSVAAFYNSDYLHARKQMLSGHMGTAPLDLYDVFIRYQSLHILRAIEPELKLHFHLLDCPPSMQDDQYASCVQHRAEGLASRSQLALLLFEQEQKRANQRDY